MKDRVTLIVYLPREIRDKIQKIADDHGTSASAIARRDLINIHGDKKK